MGELKATKELSELCHIGKDKYVLDVGCGVGITACYIAKKHRCKVVAVDISVIMLVWAKERAAKEGVADRVEFRVADAQNLPFEDALFDTVICESVNAFLPNKQRAVSEYVRVTKPGGYVGLNEATWVKAPPPVELVDCVSQTWDVKAEILTSSGWEELLRGSGLKGIVARTHKHKPSLSEYIDQDSRYSVIGYLRMWYRALALYIKISVFREYVNGRFMSLPENFFEYFGYGIYVGRK
jgi:SAM-dependent methyltransferase